MNEETFQLMLRCGAFTHLGLEHMAWHRRERWIREYLDMRDGRSPRLADAPRLRPRGVAG